MNKMISLFILLATSLSAISQEKLVLKSTADSYTYSGEKSASYGKLNRLKVIRTKGSTVLRHSYLKFDISALTPSKEISTATIKLYCNSVDDTSKGLSLEISEVSADWNESDLAWTNHPKPVKDKAGNIIVHAKGLYLEADLTSYLKQAISSGAKEISFRISDPKSTGIAVEFGSKESSNSPVLEIN